MEAKRKRVYDGEQLERRRAYQRDYGRKKRAAEKAANGTKNHKAGSPITTRAKKPMPVPNTPTEGSKAEMARFGQKWAAQKRDTQAYLAMLECEKLEAVGVWNEGGKEWFCERVERID